ncbi:MAG TPA: CHASE4 domain-containing protein [candidate division Zixibacteria bacterium]|nr:CHASE4 domain-containing protein [candidate division Zixibacteria bacterium]
MIGESFSLRQKTLLFTGITLACLVVFLYLTSSALIINGFTDVEKQNTIKNVQRAQEAMLDDIAQLSTMTRDWAWWDDTYEFIEDANPEYINANPTDESLAGLRLNVIIYVNSSGELVFGKGFDVENKKEIPIPESVKELLYRDGERLQDTENQSGISGIVLLPEGPMIISSYPILTSEWKGPVRGTLIFGRYLDEKEISRLAEITHLSLTLQRYSDLQLPDDINDLSFSDSEPIIVKPRSEQYIEGYSVLKDIFGEPALLLRVNMQRAIYGQGLASVRYLFFSLIVVGVIFGGMTLWLIEKMVLSRLSNLDHDIRKIGKSADLSGRVATEGKDELSSLGTSLNKMLEDLEHSNEKRKRAEEELKKHKDQLEDLVIGRTAELENSNKQLRFSILDREKADEALKNSEEKYRSLVESNEDSIYMVDRDCNYMFINPRHLSRLGIGDYRGRNYADCHWAVETDRFRQRVDQVIQTAKPEQHEHEFRGKWFLRTMSPLKDPKTKEVTAVTVVSTEITHRKKAEEIRLENERLDSANRAKSEFLANMSHELRTPLNSIIGFSELMKQKTAGELNNKQERYMENVLSSSNFLLNLINDILDLSKVEAGKIELILERISVPVVINETINLIKEKASKNKVVLKKELGAELDFIEADKQRVKQILFNLLTNAVKFSKSEGGTITITSKKEGDMARFSVADTGIGIKKEDIGKLFTEFEQVNVEITKKYGGTGLGLAISKKLVELHGGEIHVESIFGEGTTFTFTLPIATKKAKP